MDTGEFARLAAYAKLDISKLDALRYSEMLADRIAFPEQLPKTEQDGEAQVDHKCVWCISAPDGFRADEIIPGISRETLLQNARAVDGFFAVPRVVVD